MQQADMRKITTYFSRGFTLVEMCIVVLVLSIMVGGIMTAVTQNIRISNQALLQKRMDAIEEALLTFRKKNDRLPCPADITQVMTSANFGKDASPPSSCNGTPAANFDDGSNTVGGGVPVKALGLTDEYSFDPWGGRFLYVMDKRLTTSPAGFAYYPMNSTTIGSITVNDADGNTLVSTAIVLILSHGPNGHGSYLLSGNVKSAGATNANELQNCHCDSDGAAGAFDNIFVQQNVSTSGSDTLSVFDDIVRYYIRPGFASATDLLTESR